MTNTRLIIGVSLAGGALYLLTRPGGSTQSSGWGTVTPGAQPYDPYLQGGDPSYAQSGYGNTNPVTSALGALGNVLKAAFTWRQPPGSAPLSYGAQQGPATPNAPVPTAGGAPKLFQGQLLTMPWSDPIVYADQSYMSGSYYNPSLLISGPAQITSQGASQSVPWPTWY